MSLDINLTTVRTVNVFGLNVPHCYKPIAAKAGILKTIMPMSEGAFIGLRAAVEWNAYGARELLEISKEYPAWMKHKGNPRGLLDLILVDVAPRKRIALGISLPIKAVPFPEDKLAAISHNTA